MKPCVLSLLAAAHLSHAHHDHHTPPPPPRPTPAQDHKANRHVLFEFVDYTAGSRHGPQQVAYTLEAFLLGDALEAREERRQAKAARGRSGMDARGRHVKRVPRVKPREMKSTNTPCMIQPCERGRLVTVEEVQVQVSDVTTGSRVISSYSPVQRRPVPPQRQFRPMPWTQPKKGSPLRYEA